MKKLESKGTISLWEEEKTTLEFSSLKKNITADVCIIGGGIAGLTSAYCLLKSGFSVILLEQREIGKGDTGHTTAHLTAVLDDRYSNIIKHHGLEKAKGVAQSHQKAIDFIETLVKNEKIQCDFERLDGYLFLAPRDNLTTLEKELHAAKSVGIQADLMKRPPKLGFDLGPALRFPHQAQFHPLKYLRALAKRVGKRGGKIFENTHVEGLTIGEKIKIKTSLNSTVTANKLIICTNAPIYDPKALYAKQAPNRTYVIGAHIPKRSIKKALYWDTSDPYHYIRLYTHAVSKKDIIIIGGEDHRTGLMPDDQVSPFAELEKWARNKFLNIGEIIFKWSGQVLEPVDSLAYIGDLGEDAPNVYVATGESGSGMTYGTIAGILLSDLVKGKKNPWKEIYEPGRSTTSFLTVLKNNLKGSIGFLNKYTPGDVSSENDVVSGSGAILKCGLKKLCIHRDAEGNVVKRSAFCTHMGAIVSWNPIENSWDCPAHGSRFSTEGNVLNGPAKNPLNKI